MANQQGPTGAGNRSSSSSGKDSDNKTKSASKSGDNGSKNEGSSGTRGGTPEQHAEAGRQSHKNDK